VRTLPCVALTVLCWSAGIVAGCAGSEGDANDLVYDQEPCEPFRLGVVRIVSDSMLSASLTSDVWRAVGRVKADQSSLCIHLGTDSVSIVLFVDSAARSAHATASLERKTIFLSRSSVAEASQTWLDAMLRHEFAHLALEAQVSHLVLPAWYSEGYANHVGQSVSCTDSATAFVELALAAAQSPTERDSSALSLLQYGNRLATASAYVFAKRTTKRDVSKFHQSVRRLGFEGALRETTSGYQASLLAAWARSFSAESGGLEALPQCRK